MSGEGVFSQFVGARIGLGLEKVASMVEHFGTEGHLHMWCCYCRYLSSYFSVFAGELIGE